ncbi:MAG TPA: hypothetical protein VFZ89_10765 [Solirubrobacteraceae bacterium]
MATLAISGTLAVATAASAVSGIGPFRTTDSGDANVYPRPDAPQQSLVHNGAWTARAFVGTRSAYCVQAPPAGGPERSEMSCTSPRVVAALFDAGRAFVVVAPVHDGTSLVAGLVPAETTAVRVTDDRATSAAATLSPVWTQSAQPAARLFLVALPQGDRGGPAGLTIAIDSPSGRNVQAWPVPPPR